jgi:hypothetical protein
MAYNATTKPPIGAYQRSNMITKYIEYTTGRNPATNGVYACRCPRKLFDSVLKEDYFLTYLNGKWYHVGSDQAFRGEVSGWIGPLNRKSP